MIVHDEELRDLILQQCKKAGSQKAWAKKKKISPTVLSDLINQRRDFSVTMLKKMGVKRAFDVPDMWFEDIE